MTAFAGQHRCTTTRMILACLRYSLELRWNVLLLCCLIPVPPVPENLIIASSATAITVQSPSPVVDYVLKAVCAIFKALSKSSVQLNQPPLTVCNTGSTLVELRNPMPDTNYSVSVYHINGNDQIGATSVPVTTKTPPAG